MVSSDDFSKERRIDGTFGRDGIANENNRLATIA
jgi:hypothetical protein